MRRTVRWGGWAALAVLVLTAGCTGGPSDGAPATHASTSSTTTVPRPEPGTRLDAKGLPAPVSNLFVLGDLVAYLVSPVGGGLSGRGARALRGW